MFDILIYGASSAGLIAAIQAKRMNHSVVILEPSSRIGGLTTGGLGQTDIGNKQVVGGLAREFYQRIKAYYNNPSPWKWQTQEEYQSWGQAKSDDHEDAMWTFEPSAALKVYQQMLLEEGLEVLFESRLDRVEAHKGSIDKLHCHNGQSYRAKIFIDATYEGDLMAAAKVSYHVGRESVDTYGEEANGIQCSKATYHQLQPGIDPYRIKGNPDSGLLPGIDPSGPGNDEGGDRRIQAYCFRMCLTDHPVNRIPFIKPEPYQEIDYELLFRHYENGETHIPWDNAPMPNRKTDTNNRHGFSTDFIGQNYDYPEGSFEERQIIFEQHLKYQQGLMWTLANHPRIPQPIRDEVSKWGTCKDEFGTGTGWQTQLYIREARRLIGEIVMTQHHCEGHQTVEDSVGMAAYTMDSHHTQRYIDSEGFVQNEGDVQIAGFSPYPISYRALLPKFEECQNLLMPICLSASHIAFGSIRMEPVFMVLGQSAATAACLALQNNCSLHQLEYSSLKDQLLEDQQVLDQSTTISSIVQETA